MDLNEELLLRIKAVCLLEKNTSENDFQIRAGENGSVLINLRTGRADLIYDDESTLHDFEDLNICTPLHR